jgi:formate hydrogenlyase transcriptional activator
MDEQSTTLGTLDADCTTTTSDLPGITPSGWATKRRRARRNPPGSAAAAHGILGESVALREVVSLAQTVASTDAVVLIRGETGTGKERIAGLIHALSRRGDRRFVKFNCTAVPAGLLESELFGHERGAFTGAVVQRIGRFEVAHGGTLLLDEIGDLPPELQPKLLRVLEEQEFERLGSTRTIRTDARIITATNRPLEDLVDAGVFRADLYYRLNVFPTELPPLRDRREDIPPLVRHFAAEYARKLGTRIESIPAAVMDALACHPWPGNVRELENAIHRAVILSRGSATLELPPLDGRGNGDRSPAAQPTTLEAVTREHILAALSESSGVVAGMQGAAARLGLKRSTLQSKMQRLGIGPPDLAATRRSLPRACAGPSASPLVH